MLAKREAHLKEKIARSSCRCKTRVIGNGDMLLRRALPVGEHPSLGPFSCSSTTIATTASAASANLVLAHEHWLEGALAAQETSAATRVKSPLERSGRLIGNCQSSEARCLTVDRYLEIGSRDVSFRHCA